MANKINVKDLKEMSAQKAFRQLAKSCENSCNLHYSSIDAKYKTVAEIRVVLSIADKDDDYKNKLEKIINGSGIEMGKNFKFDLLKSLHVQNKEDKKFEKYLYSLLRVIKKLDELDVKLSDSYKYLKKHGLDVLSNNRKKDKEDKLKKSEDKASDESLVNQSTNKINDEKSDRKNPQTVKVVFEGAIKGILSCYGGEKYKNLKKQLLSIAKRLDADEALGLGAIVKNCVKEFKNAKK